MSPLEQRTYVPLADVPWWPCAQCLEDLGNKTREASVE